ncbi:MAG: DUF2807 domain-containing protein [Planctomycetaceae bacterium]|nr:DUF2807 domain-containing protein [Planctomycetaceae bacterium]
MSNTMFRLFAIVSCAFLSGCLDSPSPNATGSGVSSSEQRTIPRVNEVELYGVGALTVDSGGEPNLTIEADDNMLQYVESSVDGETLRVGVGNGTYVWNTGYPRISLEGVNASSYELSGQTQLVLNEVELESLSLSLDGQCTVSVNGNIRTLTIDVAGQCSIDASNASIESIIGNLSGQSTLICGETTDVKVEKNKDSVIQRVEPK